MWLAKKSSQESDSSNFGLFVSVVLTIATIATAGTAAAVVLGLAGSLILIWFWRSGKESRIDS